MQQGVVLVGAGRIGRLLLREWRKAPAAFPLVGVVDTADPDKLAALIDFDTSYGRGPAPVRFNEGAFDLGEGIRVPFYRPEAAPWREWEGALVVEATGRLSRRSLAEAYLEQGAGVVLATMPPKRKEDADAVLLQHVNHTEYQPGRHRILYAASCTTNCLVHPLAALRRAGIRVESGFFLTVHSVTNTQRLVDAPADDLSDSWSAFQNIIVSESGAARAIGMVFPDLEGKISGRAARVPTLTGSLLEGYFRLTEPVSREQILAALRAYEEGREAAFGITGEAHLPSRAFVGDTRSCVLVEPGLEVRGDLVRIAAWYDNEMGYVHRLLGLCGYIGGRG